MAKMFYTLEEAAEKLGMDPEAVKEMATAGKLQQFRDRDKLMFKTDEVDKMADSGGTSAGTMAGGPQDSQAGDTGPIPISSGEETEAGLELSPEDTGHGSDAGDPAQGTAGGTDSINLASDDPGASGTGAGDTGQQKEDPSGQTGVSVFDADEVDDADPQAQTQVNQPAVDDEEMQLDSVGSGSGLLDLTRESDDTSLGAELLDEIYPGEDQQQGGTGSGTGSAVGSSGVLDATQQGGDSAAQGASQSGFEALETGTGTEVAMDQPEEPASQAPGAAPAVATAEPYDPAGSGFGAGMLLGTTIALILGLIIAIGAVGGSSGPVLDLMTGDPGSNMLMIWTAGLIIVSFIFGVVGLVIGKAAAK